MSGSRKSRNASRTQHIVVHSNDVLNGRGVKIAQHQGNLRFRSLVKEMKDDRYCEKFTSSEKKALAREIILHIKDNLTPPGRFLKRHGQDGPWIELTKAEIEKKTKQALRDCNRSDRQGYADQVTAPQDVENADTERKKSGLSLQEHARKQLDVESRTTRTRGGSNNRKTSSTSGAVSRPSRQSNRGASASATPGNTVSNINISSRRTGLPIEFPFERPLVAAPQESSNSAWVAPPSTISATPAARPYAAPVTQTPHPPNSLMYQATGHSHNHAEQIGSQPPIGSNPRLASYHHGYAPRHNFNHHAPAAEAVNPEVTISSPILSSPIVTQNNSRVFEGHHEAFLDDWTTEGHRQNLFPPEDPLDPLDSLAASASDCLSHDRDFMLAFGSTHDVPDVTDSNDLKF